MRALRLLDAFRDRGWEARFGGDGDDFGGCFKVRAPGGALLRIIASNGEGWDHVSVSLHTRCPTWEEMEHVKRLFFKEDECAMQLHVPTASHINNHSHCLHIWRPHNVAIPTPPSIMVGIAGVELA